MSWFKREFPDFLAWLAFTGVAVIGVLLSSGTTYHRLAIALLASAVAWLVLIGVFEAVWHLAMGALRAAGLDPGERTEPKDSR